MPVKPTPEDRARQDVPRVEVPRYTSAPAVTVAPVTEVIPELPVSPANRWPGHYQSILLNVRTGELRFHESTQHLEEWNPSWTSFTAVPHEIRERWHPGTSVPWRGPWLTAVPELISWVVDTGTTAWPYLDVDGANALLAKVAPHAQALLERLFVAGTDLDWSADSAHAGRNIRRLTSRSVEEAAGTGGEAAGRSADADLVNYGAVVRAFPQAFRPEWLRLSLEELDQECEYMTRFLSSEHWHPEIREHFGTVSHQSTQPNYRSHPAVLGVRAWYRAAVQAAGPGQLVDFRDWDAHSPALRTSGITASTTDQDLETWIGREEKAAANQGVRLLGTAKAAYDYRAWLRGTAWDRLAVVGAEVERLESELAAVRAERSQLLDQVITWENSDTTIGSRARMSRQMVNRVRVAKQEHDQKN
jgi:hypothetical protein